MKRALALLPMILGSCAPSAPVADQPVAAAELAGRVAEAPVHCVTISSSNSLRVSDNDRSLLLYGSGRTIWANQLGRGCSIGYHDVLVTQPFGSNYCRGDIVRTYDQSSRIPGPSCILQDFVPYTAR